MDDFQDARKIMKLLQTAAQLVIHLIYLAVCFVFSISQQILRINKKIDKIPTAHARICSILYRHKRDPEEISTSNDFLTLHESFKPVDFLDEHWALYCFDRKHAVLVELPDHANHYSSIEFPFCYIPFFEKATRLAYVTIDDFIAFCDQLEAKPQPQTVLFTNTARCGSTLMASMLTLEGASVCFAEPYVLTNLSIGTNEGYYSKAFLEKVLPPAITYLRKEVPSDQVCVLKTSSTEARLVPFTKNVSNLKHIFMFRKNGLASVEKVVRRDESLPYLLEVYKRMPIISNFIGYLVAGDGDFVQKLMPRDVLEYAAIVYAAPYSHYLNNKDKYTEIVWYHDVMNDGLKTMTDLFEKLGIPTSRALEALERKGFDSQEGTFLSRQALSGIVTSQPTEEQKHRLKHFCEVMEIPETVLLGA